MVWWGASNVYFFLFYQLISSIKNILKICRVNATKEENLNEILNDSMAFFICSMVLTVILLISGIFTVDCFNRSAIRQISCIRIQYFASLMRQDIGWYDITSGKSNFTARLTELVFIYLNFAVFFQLTR